MKVTDETVAAAVRAYVAAGKRGVEDMHEAMRFALEEVATMTPDDEDLQAVIDKAHDDLKECIETLDFSRVEDVLGLLRDGH